MAVYQIARDLTLSKEGIGPKGWVKHPDDSGGETFMGISRVWHPSWGGWKILDILKRDRIFPKNIISNTPLYRQLVDLVHSFYKEEYWDKVQGDLLDSQPLANALYDFAVHRSPQDAIESLQRTLNFFNLKGTLYDDILPDGDMGSKTMAALSGFILAGKPIDFLIEYLLADRLIYARDKAYERSPDAKETFADGWTKRIASFWPKGGSNGLA